MTAYLGDIHGDLGPFWFWQSRTQAENFNLVSVGDFGVGFPLRKDIWLEEVNACFAAKNIFCYVVRGNHDDPAYFKGDCRLSNLYLVPDNEVIEIDGKHHLFFGGGISIDRTLRKENWDYWSGEVTGELEINCNKIDIVISHLCPTKMLPVSHPKLKQGILSRIKNDPDLICELCQELDKMDRIQEKLISKFKIENWYFGHYHKSHTVEEKGVIYKCLDINEIAWKN